MDINNFKAYKETKMEKGSQYIYELIDVSPDPLNKGMLQGSWTYISPTDTIEHDGKFEDIAMIIRYDKDGKHDYNLDVSFSPHNRFRLALTPGNPIHEDIYKFFTFCNKNESNPNRRQDVPAVFRRVDVVGNAKTENKKEKELFDAMAVYYGLKDEEAKSIALVMGIPDDEIDIVKNNLLKKVKEKTSDFLKLAKTPTKQVDYLAKIKEALKQGVLKNDSANGKVLFGDDERVVFQYDGKRLKEQELLEEIKVNHPYILEAI